MCVYVRAHVCVCVTACVLLCVQMIIQTLKVKQFERRIELEEDFDDGGMYEARYKRQKV